MQAHAQGRAKGDAKEGVATVQISSGLQKLDVKH